MMVFDLMTWFTVSVRYRTKRDGYRSVHYQIRAESAEQAKTLALMRAYRIRGSDQHDAEVTVA